jgi:3-methyladenine DNA glycosylase AlkD
MSTASQQQISAWVAQVDAQIQAGADPEFQARQQGYSKDQIKSLGLRTPAVREIAKQRFSELKQLPPDQLLEYCNAMLAFGYEEHRTLAFAWAFKQVKRYEARHFQVFEAWLRDHVSNWAACDQLCCEVLGHFLLRFPQFYPQVEAWSLTDDRWFQRASAVALIPAFRKSSEQLPRLQRVVLNLIHHKDDLVQKGYGWALKTAMERDQASTFAFVLSQKAIMPRTALRYAIEKLPKEMKEQAMH